METTELAISNRQKLGVTDQPEIRTSIDGYDFSLNDRYWELNKDVTVGVDWSAKLAPVVHRSYLEVLAFYAEDYSADHTYNMNSRAKAFFKFAGDGQINVNSLISYRSTLDKSTEHYLGAFRGLIRKWYELGYPGVSEDVIDLLAGWRLKGNEKGRAVQMFDPIKGPLTDIEMQALTERLLQGYVQGDLKLYSYALLMTLVYTGRRRVQIVSLKIKDLQCYQRDDVDRYLINFPRAKQRGIGWRKQFTPYPIVEDLWLLLNQHKNSVISRVTETVGERLSNDLLGELPLFPNHDSFYGVSVASLTDSLKRDVHHAPRNLCNEKLSLFAEKLPTPSERTGEPIQLSPTRFRRTLGTNLAREGKGVYVIAEALDHSDTQNTGTYVKNLPDIVERIDKAVAKQLAPLAKAFQGILVKTEQDAVRGDDRASRISNGRVNVGSCGSAGFCGGSTPEACYPCTRFQPWEDAPHEQILDELIEERDRVLENTGDIKIAAVNDRVILAVSDVINRCDQKKASQGDVNNG